MSDIKEKMARFCQSKYDREEILNPRDSVKFPSLKFRGDGIDTEKLENVVNDGDRIIARCPACSKFGQDKTGNHLVLWADGKFSCVINPGEDGRGHRREIWGLVGGKTGKFKPKSADAIETIRNDQIKRVEEQVRDNIPKILEEYSLRLEDFKASSNPLQDCGKWHYKQQLSLYNDDDIIWAGSRYDSATHYFHKKDWERVYENIISPQKLDHSCGVTWKQGTNARKKSNVDRVVYTTIEHDSLDYASQIGIIKYIESLGFNFFGVLDTSGKSLHGLLDTRAVYSMTMRNLIPILRGLGADIQSFNGAMTRTAGSIRRPDKNNNGGGLQRFVWLPKTK